MKLILASYPVQLSGYDALALDAQVIKLGTKLQNCLNFLNFENQHWI